MTTPDLVTSQSAEREHAIGVRLFNQIWDYRGSGGRTREEDDTMLHMAHASRLHWGNAGGPEHRASGEWQCSRVYAVLGRAEPSLHHAARVLAISQRHDIADSEDADLLLADLESIPGQPRFW